jgi:hypothetical protein
MNKMKPIIFSTPMVVAILEGRKTQTRRVIMPRPDRFFEVDDTPGNFHIYDVEWGLGRIYPKYQVGDILWVRETWGKDENGEYVYRTNYGTTEDDSFPSSMFKWRSSRYMPKEAARIFLKVTNVRVERVQDITIKDIRSEGTTLSKIEEPEVSNEAYLWFEFQNLWNSTVKKSDLDTYGWNANPWVWVYEFERVEGE